MLERGSLDGSEDVYGVGANPTDVNEDPNRESLLDRSMVDFTENIRQVIRQKNLITNVPEPSVFDAAVEIDAEPSEE
jgi:hypothetical protein